jgi:hypothetical protein
MRKKFRETIQNMASVLVIMAFALGLLAPAYAAASVTVTIQKYVDGSTATASSAGSSAFPVSATWTATSGSGSGTFTLDPSGFNSGGVAYTAVTAAMDNGASYSATETTGGSLVGADCSASSTFRLVGYSVGTSLVNAAAASVSTTAPALTNIQANQFIIVRNRHCVPTPQNVAPTNGSSTSQTPTTMFDWTDVTDAVGGISYYFELSNSSATNSGGGFSSVLTSANNLSTSSITLNNLAPGTYFWHVLAQDAAQNVSSYSSTFSLTVTQASGGTATSTVKVHILKYLNGSEATASSANNYQFPMQSTWLASNLNGGAQTSGTFVLGNNFGGSSHLYGADTASMNLGANYTTNEVTGSGSQVVAPGQNCPQGMYQLVGYTTSGTSFADAASHTPTTSAPSFSSLQGDQYVIVWNNICGTTVPPTNNGTSTLTIVKIALGGDGTFHFKGNHSVGEFDLSTTNSVGVKTLSLAPGRYNIQEKQQQGWSGLLNTCRNVVVRAGQTSVCIVVNQIRPQWNRGHGWGQGGNQNGNAGNFSDFLGALSHLNF